MRASDRAYHALREAILDGTLAPGTVLGEVEQSQRLGVSRTPVREALSRLAADGLVAPAGRGQTVTEISIDNITELFEVRRALEEQSARLAAQRRDPVIFEELAQGFREAPVLLTQGVDGIHRYYQLVQEFDDAVDAAVGNSYLTGALDGVRVHLARIRRLSRHNPGRLQAAASEHLLIVEAIAAGDGNLAADATHVHLHLSLVNILVSAETTRFRASKVEIFSGTDDSAGLRFPDYSIPVLRQGAHL